MERKIRRQEVVLENRGTSGNQGVHERRSGESQQVKEASGEAIARQRQKQDQEGKHGRREGSRLVAEGDRSSKEGGGVAVGWASGLDSVLSFWIRQSFRESAWPPGAAFAVDAYGVSSFVQSSAATTPRNSAMKTTSPKPLPQP